MRYEITSPEGKRFEITAPEGATEDQVLAYAQEQFKSVEPEDPGILDFPDIPEGRLSEQIEEGSVERLVEEGLGPDIQRQIGLAGRYGLEGLGSAAEVFTAPVDVPMEMAGLQVTGRGRKLADYLNLPKPETPTERVVGEASKFLTAGGGFVGGARKIAPLVEGAPRKVAEVMAARPAAQAVSAVGAGGGVGVAREAELPWYAQLGAGLLGGGVGMARIPKKINEAFMKAHKIGYTVPPSMAKPTVTQQAVEGIAGPVPTKQRASIKNQENTNRLIKEEIGYNKDVPLSKEGLEGIRSEAGKIYDQATKLGTFTVDKSFNQQLGQISKEGSALQKDFPGLVSKDVIKLINSFKGKKTVSAEGVVEAVKKLRADASTGFKSQDPNVVNMARAKGKLANSLEGLMERNIETGTGKEFLQTFRNARQRIAKTYTIENALKGENVDAVALGRQLDKGKPLSGKIKDVAEFGQYFKGAAQVNPPQTTNFRGMDIVAAVGSTAWLNSPVGILALGARPALRTIMLSKPYQGMMARVKPGAIKRVLKLRKEDQAAALEALLAEHNQNFGNSDST